MNLPDKPHVGNSKHINSLLIVSRPKIGKTRSLMQLPNSLLIDLEGSSKFFDGVAIDIKEESIKLKKGPISTLYALGKQIDKANKELGTYKYEYGIIDTVTKLEDFLIPYVTAKFKSTQMGQNYTGTNILTDLEYGAGYRWLRDSFSEVIDMLTSLFKTTIFTGHVKDSSINMMGQNLSVTDLDLTGKLKNILTAQCDAIGFMYRDEENENTCLLSFKTNNNDLIIGARPEHLSGKIIKVSHLGAEFTTNWDQIFTDLITS